MKRDTLFGAVLSAAMVTAIGVALAADVQPSTDSGASGSAGGGMNLAVPTEPNTLPSATMSGESGAPSAMSPGMSSEAVSPPAAPPESVIGLDLIGSGGEKIGKVSKIHGDKVIVSVGGFLGIGSHNVALDWKQLETTGRGDDMKLQTTLTKDEIRDMAKYEK